MGNQIQYTVEFTINDGGVEKFKELAAACTKAVQENDKGCQGYNWYFSDDETMCYLCEWYENSESIMAHLGTVGELLGQLLEVSSISRFEVFGDVSDDVKGAAGGFGAKFFNFSQGFTR